MRDAVLQTCMGGLGALGFAIIFNVHGKKLVWITAGGMLSWGTYLVCMGSGDNLFTSLLLASAAIALVCEILARVIKTPVITLLVPMLIPLIPGGDLYYTIYYWVREDDRMFKIWARLVLTEAGAIAVGIICTISVVSIIYGLSGKTKVKNRQDG